MKISTLLDREPFEDIFKKTLESFLLDWSGQSHKVRWEGNNGIKVFSAHGQLWYCNPLINSIFVKNVNNVVFKSINGEYSKNSYKPWLSGLQKMYLKISQSNFCATKMAKYRISIYPEIEDATNKLIIGGNTKIRLIDIHNNIVFVILKNGYDQKYIDREIFVRNEFRYIPIPGVIKLGSKFNWYSEEYILGQPPNRYNKDIEIKFVSKAISCIHRMIYQTQRRIELIKYLDILEVKIFTGMNKIKSLKPETYSEIESSVYFLRKILKKYEKQIINLAYCHGDFHMGNILTDSEQYWILDWEYSGERQIAYDLIILLLETRIESGFASRFINLIENNLKKTQSMIAEKWPGMNWNSEARLIYCIVFLLEDIIFYLEENNNEMFHKNPNLFKERSIEIQKIIKYFFDNNFARST